MITRTLLRTLRSDLPMPYVFTRLGHKAPYAKLADGRFRFICPYCGELLATLNPKNNLAHCFCCHKNLNNIDLMMLLGYRFLDAVKALDQWHHRFKREKPPDSKNDRPHQGPQKIAEILFQDLNG